MVMIDMSVIAIQKIFCLTMLALVEVWLNFYFRGAAAFRALYCFDVLGHIVI